MTSTVIVLLGHGFRVLQVGWATGFPSTIGFMAMPTQAPMSSWWLELCFASPRDCERL